MRPAESPDGIEWSEVADSEQLIRRFDPENRNHVVQDEGDAGFALRSGAICFDPDEDGVSAYRTMVLDHFRIAHSVVMDGRYSGLAWFVVKLIRDCDSALECVARPWPTGVYEMPHRDVAHALMTCDGTRSASRKIAHKLARLAHRVDVPSPERTRTALASGADLTDPTL